MISNKKISRNLFLHIYLLVLLSDTNNRTSAVNASDIAGDFLEETTIWAMQNILKDERKSECSAVFVSDGVLREAYVFKELFHMKGMGGFAFLEIPFEGYPRINSNSSFIQSALEIKTLRERAKCFVIILVSIHFEFFTHFAEVSMEVRLLRWSTKLLFISDLSNLRLHQLFVGYQTFSEMNTMALIPRNDRGTKRYELYVYLPFTPLGPKMKRIIYVANKDKLSASGYSVHFPPNLHRKSILFPPKYDNFWGAKKEISAIIKIPYVMKKVIETSEGNEEVQLSGREYLVMDAVARNLNFTFYLKPALKIGDMAVAVANGSFLGGMRIAMLPEFLKKADFTIPIEPATLTFTMLKPTLKSQWQSLYRPFTDHVWVGIIATLLVMPLFMSMVVSKRKRNRTWRISPEATELGIGLKTSGIFLGQDELHGFPNATSTRLLLGTWVIFAFLIGTFYRTTLTSFLTIPKYPERIDTVEQLASSGAKSLLRVNGRSFYNYMGKSNNKALNKIHKRAQILPTTLQCLQTVLDSSEPIAYFHERRSLEITLAKLIPDKRIRTRFYLAKESAHPAFAGWVIPKGAPYKDNINGVLLHIKEAGLIDKWTDDVMTHELRKISIEQEKADESIGFTSEGDGNETKPKDGGPIPLTIVHLQGIFFITLLGYLLSLIAFIAEMVQYGLKFGTLRRRRYPLA